MWVPRGSHHALTLIGTKVARKGVRLTGRSRHPRLPEVSVTASLIGKTNSSEGGQQSKSYYKQARNFSSSFSTGEEEIPATKFCIGCGLRKVAGFTRLVYMIAGV